MKNYLIKQGIFTVTWVIILCVLHSYGLIFGFWYFAFYLFYIAGFRLISYADRERRKDKTKYLYSNQGKLWFDKN